MQDEKTLYDNLPKDLQVVRTASRGQLMDFEDLNKLVNYFDGRLSNPNTYLDLT